MCLKTDSCIVLKAILSRTEISLIVRFSHKIVQAIEEWVPSQKYLNAALKVVQDLACHASTKKIQFAYKKLFALATCEQKALDGLVDFQ